MYLFLKKGTFGQKDMFRHTKIFNTEKLFHIFTILLINFFCCRKRRNLEKFPRSYSDLIIPSQSTEQQSSDYGETYSFLSHQLFRHLFEENVAIILHLSRERIQSTFLRMETF